MMLEILAAELIFHLWNEVWMLIICQHNDIYIIITKKAAGYLRLNFLKQTEKATSRNQVTSGVFELKPWTLSANCYMFDKVSRLEI